MWNLLRDLGTRLLRDLTGISRERQELLAAQIRLNERETENAPSSVLRLWRSFLGWVLALLFCWEVPVRLLLLPLLAPDLLDDLPPPAGDSLRRSQLLRTAWGTKRQPRRAPSPSSAPWTVMAAPGTSCHSPSALSASCRVRASEVVCSLAKPLVTEMRSGMGSMRPGRRRAVRGTALPVLSALRGPSKRMQ